MRAFKTLKIPNYIDRFCYVLICLFFEPYHNQFSNFFLYHMCHFLAINEDHVSQGPNRAQVVYSNQVTKENVMKILHSGYCLSYKKVQRIVENQGLSTVQSHQHPSSFFLPSDLLPAPPIYQTYQEA